MARKNIELGVIPSGQGGDTFRSAMIKVNDMTAELYTAIEEGGGKVQTVAGVDPDAAGDIPKASLVTALGVDGKADKAATESALNSKITTGTVGLDSSTAPPVVDANKVTKGGFHALVPTSLNHAGTDDMSFMHIPHSPDAWSQIAIGQGAGSAVFVRSQNKTTKTPGPWTRLVKVLDYGIGANSNAVWSGTELDPDTFRTQGDYIGSFALKGFWTMTGYLTVSPGSTVNTCAQIFQANGTNEMYSRAMNGSTWAPWARMVRPGDYGVGSVKLVFCQDANTVTESGSLAVGPETANCVGTYGTLRTEFYEKSSGNFTQLAQSLNGQGEWFRSSINGSITPWRMIGINRSETTSGAMPRAPAGTNLNVLPDYCHRVWIDSSSFWGPSAADWLVEHTFIQPGYAWQTAQALNPDVKGIWTRVQNGGTWSPWAAPAVTPKRYQSAGLTFTNGQLQAVQHGLGAIPFSLQIFAVPVVDQASWSAGIRMSPASGYTVGADATQIYIKVATGGMTVIDAQTGASVVITPANWRIEVRASI
ncbi:pyocin knob domain-containing protein [Pseudomonas protegens]|uniref:pyocin knob domain-containing protein n=1 Tax=Pseudomonas protegens TaxID=380021 RepID=UPI00366E6A3F